MGFLRRKTAPSADLVSEGIRGKATVEHVDQPRYGMEMNLGRRSAQKLLSGEV